MRRSIAAGASARQVVFTRDRAVTVKFRREGTGCMVGRGAALFCVRAQGRGVVFCVSLVHDREANGVVVADVSLIYTGSTRREESV